MVIALGLVFVLATPQTTEIRTEIQVEATKPPDRRAELAGEISRAQSELEEVRRVMQTLPDGEEKEAESKRIKALDDQIKEMRKLVSQLPDPPRDLVQPVAGLPSVDVASTQQPEAELQSAVAPSSVWIGWGFGLIIGVFLAFAFAFRALPGQLPEGAMRMPQLAVVAALLAAIDPQLQALNYDQLPIIFGWVVLSVGAVIRLGMRRMRSQIEVFSINRVHAQRLEDEHE